MEPGDCLLSYTDALIETRDSDGEMLGEACHEAGQLLHQGFAKLGVIVDDQNSSRIWHVKPLPVR